MEMEKKNLAIIILAIVLAASGIGNVILAITGGLIAPKAEKLETVSIAVGYPGLAKNDPVDTWDRVSIWHQQAITEGLVYYDTSKHPNYEPTPLLAEEWKWFNNDLSIKFKIRDNVYFHDGSRLTASAVKWNFERLMHFCNVTGELVANETSHEAFPGSLYFLPNGTYLFKGFEANETDIWDGEPAMTFTIHLNGKFGVLLDLLCYAATTIISPKSHSFYNLVQLNEMLVGTGPFMEKVHKPRNEVRYVRNGLYWKTGAYFEQLIMKFIDDDIARMNAGLAGQYDYVANVLKTYIETFRDTEGMWVQDVGPSTSYYYIEIYCGPRDTDGDFLYDKYEGVFPNKYQAQKNPSYLRRAMAIALNHTYIIEEIQQGLAYYGIPAVPRAMPGHNASVYMGYNASFDLGYKGAVQWARQILIDNAADIKDRGGKDISGWKADDDDKWEGADILNRILQLNEHSGGGLGTDLNILFQDSWSLIGIKCKVTVREWAEYLDEGEHTPWEMDAGVVGWGPDYLNPYNMIDPLYNLASGSCFSRNNDTSTNGLIARLQDAVEESNYTIQLQKWMDLQSYLYDVRFDTPGVCTHIPTYTYFAQQVHKETLKGVQYNVIGPDFAFGNWYREE